jgi:hypothetical protein|tara:strand:- start:190 stop:414 length:225 start_codon:yes stop_codon:yes gene_type:complete
MNKKIVSEIIKRQYTIMMGEEKSLRKLLQAETNLAPADQLDGLYTRIEQHLGVISHAQNKIMLLQEIAEQNDEG